MFLKITKKRYNGKEYRQASIVETVRVGGKVVQRLVKNVGVLRNQEDENKAKHLIESVRQGKKLVMLDEINESCYEFGVKLIVDHLWRQLKLSTLFKELRVDFDIEQILCLLISHRLHNYGSCNLSEREGYRWIKEEAYHTLKKLELQHVYRSLFHLFSKKEQIEIHLSNVLSIKKEIIFYDLTSSYVEGKYKNSEIIDFGYNRDKKRGKEQLVLGLLLAENLPFAHTVWKGNTTDKTTLQEAVEHAQKLGVLTFVFVADRGLITDKNIEWLEEKNLEYILATKRRKDNFIKKIITKDVSDNVTLVCEHENRRYFLCCNDDVAKQERAELSEIRKSSEEKIKAVKNPTEHKILEAVGKAKRLFRFNFNKEFSYTLNQKEWDYETKIAGRFVLVTNNQKLSKDQVYTTYKQLIDIEQCFGELKHFEDMRPFFHKSDGGLKAHIFLCILTLLIERLVKKRINDMTQRQVFTELKKIRLCKVKDNFVRTDLTPTQRKILSGLGINQPPKVM